MTLSRQSGVIVRLSSKSLKFLHMGDLSTSQSVQIIAPITIHFISTLYHFTLHSNTLSFSFRFRFGFSFTIGFTLTLRSLNSHNKKINIHIDVSSSGYKSVVFIYI